MKRTLLCISIALLFLAIGQVSAQPTGYDNPLQAENIVQFVERAIMVLFTAALYGSPLLIIIGAYVMVTSGGNPRRADLGKKIIIWTLIGLTVMLVARGIIALALMILGA